MHNVKCGISCTFQIIATTDREKKKTIDANAADFAVSHAYTGNRRPLPNLCICALVWGVSGIAPICP